jgi:hypothetical protein
MSELTTPNAAPMPEALTAYLRTLPQVLLARPLGGVTIGKTSYAVAARYFAKNTAPLGSPKEGETYTREFVYVVGVLPKELVSDRKKIILPNDTRDWYLVGGYYFPEKSRTQQVREPNDFHPFGSMFILSPWDSPGKIDEHEAYAQVDAWFHNESDKVSDGPVLAVRRDIVVSRPISTTRDVVLACDGREVELIYTLFGGSDRRCVLRGTWQSIVDGSAVHGGVEIYPASSVAERKASGNVIADRLNGGRTTSHWRRFVSRMLHDLVDAGPGSIS